MRRTPGTVWGGHASRALVAVVLAAHAAALVWFCKDVDRVRLVGYDFHEVSSEALINDPPDVLRAIGYVEDDPSELAMFRAIAAPLVAGSAGDAEKMRRLGDYIYSLRVEGAPDFEGPKDPPLSEVWRALQRGDHGSCGEMSLVLAAFWRSLGGHTRGLRWATAEGQIGHVALELYATDWRRWAYYDMNLNGYGEDEDGVPQSIAALRSHLLTGEDVHLVSNPHLRDWSAAEFRTALLAFPVEWYVLNNRALYFDADRRFGRFNRFAWFFNRLPAPLDRIADNLVGDRDRRFVVEGKIQVADLFTFEGARWFLAYLTAMIAACGSTLIARPAIHAARALGLVPTRRSPDVPDVRFRDASVPPPVT